MAILRALYVEELSQENPHHEVEAEGEGGGETV
jgi:hypothetical protein